MALSLVGDYGGSGSSSDESEEESEDEQTKPTKPQISLPSAADLFDSVEANSASYMSAPVPSADTPLTTPKRKNKDGGGSGSGSGAKKSKSSSAGDKQAAGKGGGGGGGPSRGLIPPQMSRPNIVTEDSALWSSDSAIKRQRHVEAEKKGRARKEKDAEKGGKESLSYKQREKAKRDKGQASRGKSYVEEEKRLLRELGSS